MNSVPASPDVKIHLKSNPNYLPTVRGMTLSLTQTLGFDMVESGHIALAVDETLANIIRHGYQLQDDKPIDVSIWLIQEEPKGIRIVIEDEAKQIEPAEICGRDLEDIKPGGLGVHIINDVMDECTFEKRDGTGMRVTLMKHLTSKKIDCTENSNTPR
jgi:anti-sigma regulatory factor (Ser/Thr protein kinase)